jgi:hypothetical protein
LADGNRFLEQTGKALRIGDREIGQRVTEMQAAHRVIVSASDAERDTAVSRDDIDLAVRACG